MGDVGGADRVVRHQPLFRQLAGQDLQYLARIARGRADFSAFLAQDIDDVQGARNDRRIVGQALDLQRQKFGIHRVDIRVAGGLAMHLSPAGGQSGHRAHLGDVIALCRAHRAARFRDSCFDPAAAEDFDEGHDRRGRPKIDQGPGVVENQRLDGSGIAADIGKAHSGAPRKYWSEWACGGRLFTLRSGCRAGRYLHLGHHVAYGLDRARHIALVQPSDAADTETFGDRELARIDQETAFGERVIEGLETEIRMARHAEGDDDRCLQSIRQQCLEAEIPQAVDQRPAIPAVPSAAPGDPTFVPMFVQGLGQGGDDMDRRGETVLARSLQRQELIRQVQAQRMGIARRRAQSILAA